MEKPADPKGRLARRDLPVLTCADYIIGKGENNMKRSISGPLSILLVLCMALSLLPAPALAAGNWAAPAVTALKKIYGDVFSDDIADKMTWGDAAGFFAAVGYNQGGADNLAGLDESDEPNYMTRGDAATVLAEIYNLPIGSGSAIQYLYAQNIVNGKSDGQLHESDPITKAEFAVLTYRVLNLVGGGQGAGTAGVTPGGEQYFSWMYLFARNCLSYEDGAKTDATAEAINEGTWNRWKERLTSLGINGISDYDGEFPKETDISQVDNEEEEEKSNTSKLDAAVMMVKQVGATTIFEDVQPGDGIYDGVMYLFDHGIVSGKGNGKFDPGEETNYAQIAVLLCRAGGIEYGSGSGGHWASGAIEAIKDIVDWSGKDLNAAATREDTIVAILKFCEEEYNIEDINKENTAILDRFTDGGNVSSDNEPYIAYAVSHGLLTGTADGRLNIGGAATRGQAGVLLYRALTGVDATKMKDYEDSVDFALGRENGTEDSGEESNSQDQSDETENNDSGENSQTEEITRLFTRAASLAGGAGDETAKTLKLREDWRLTGDLDLKVAADQELIIDGQGKNYIYEVGGSLTNSGEGTVCFKDTILYPQSSGQQVNGQHISLTASRVSVAAPARGATQVKYNGLEDGYEVKIKASSNKTVIDLTGKITPPASNTSVTLTLTVHDNDKPGEYAQITRTVTVPGTSTGGGSSTSSSSSTSVNSPSTSAGGNTTTVEVSTSSTTSGTTAKASVSGESMDQAVASVIAEAAKQNTAPVVEVEVKTSPAAKSLEVALPAASLEKLAGTKDASLVVTSAIAEVALDHTALGAVAGQATGGTVVLEVTPVAESTLTKAQKESVGGAGVTVLDVSLLSNGVVISDYKGGKLTVTLPYTLSEGASANDVSVYYLDNDGGLTDCDASYAGGKVTFTTSA